MKHTRQTPPTYHKIIKKLANTNKLEALKGLLKDLDAVEIANSFLQLKLKHQLTIIKRSASRIVASGPRQRLLVGAFGV